MFEITDIEVTRRVSSHIMVLDLTPAEATRSDGLSCLGANGRHPYYGRLLQALTIPQKLYTQFSQLEFLNFVACCLGIIVDPEDVLRHCDIGC